jgi:hypothetical protein
MKRSELLKYLQSQGCEFIREGSAIHGGGTPAKINGHQFQDTMKSTIILLGKFVKTSP